MMDADNLGLTVKFNFNCIIIDKDGIHSIDLESSDPIAALEADPTEAKVDAPMATFASEVVA
jgi:20S proteasome subunit beta 4